MSIIRRLVRCNHCGEVLHSDDENLKGFITKSVFEEGLKDARVLYCNNCYDLMKEVNNSELEREVDDEIIKILNDAKATDAVILWVIDLVTFGGIASPEIIKRIKKLPLVVIGTKFDLLPKHTKKETIERFINERFNEYGIKPSMIKIVGNSDEIDYHELLESLREIRQGHDIFMIGSEFSGKTNVVNKILKRYTNKSKREIKTQVYAGTNQKVLEIPLSNSSFLYELPSFSLAISVLGKVEKEVLKQVTVHSQIEKESKSLDEGEALVIGSLAALCLHKGKHTNVKIYASDKVEYKRIKEKDLNNFIIENNQKHSVRPVSERLTSFRDYDAYEFEIDNDGLSHDIYISGLGWFALEGKGQTMRVYSPKGVALKECLSKIR